MGAFTDKIKSALGKKPEAGGPSPEVRRNGVLLDDVHRKIMVVLYMDGETALRDALGSLEISKDIIKSIMSQWEAKKEATGILKLNGGLHVQ